MRVDLSPLAVGSSLAPMAPVPSNLGAVAPVGHGVVDLLLASSVADRFLVLVGTFDGCVDGMPVTVTDADGTTTEVAARCWHDPRGLHSLLVVRMEASRPHSVAVHDGSLVLGALRNGLQPVLRFGATAADAATRASVMAFLVEALGDDDHLDARLSTALHEAREALRERAEPSVVDPTQPPGMVVELAVTAGHRGVYLRGWIGEPTHRLRHVHAISPEGERTELLPSLFRFPKADVAAFYGLRGRAAELLGFAARVAGRYGTTSTNGWIVEVETVDGRRFEAAAPEVVTDPARARELLLYELTLEPPPTTDLRSRHVGPALTGMLSASREHVRIVREVQYGTPPSAPEVSIIVPLYRRIDFVEHQLAQFVHDPELAAADLVYVLDSPEQGEQLVAMCGRLHRLYRLPFRVVVLSENSGFSTANNMGVSVARGRLLLLLNSDVLPAAPGWLGDLVRFHDSVPDVGCVGPKLLYEDDSIQHAGMYFERAAGTPTWVNEHHFKGMHRSFPPACVDRRVAAITGACLLIDAERYRAVGGLLGSFVQGDYEDSDLCLRLHRLGHQNWYCASTELYHLEGQSYPTPLRVLNHEFNTWLHTAMWDDTIARIVDESAGWPTRPPSGDDADTDQVRTDQSRTDQTHTDPAGRTPISPDGPGVVDQHPTLEVI